ncbi:MAG: sensor histidine kinase, partial [Ardenticatenaceae bacterium]
MSALAKFREVRARSWWIVGASVIGLLVAITIAGLVGLGLNARVERLTDQTLRYDLALEDISNELRVAALELRHRHRNIMLSPALSRHSVARLDGAYTQLLTQIERLDELGVPDSGQTPPPQLRQMAERYYADFRPVIASELPGSVPFTRAADDGLVRLDQIVQASEAIGQFGEQQAHSALESLEQVTGSSRGVLLAVLAGLVLAGAGLALATVRIVNEQEETARQLSAALLTKSNFIADASHELRTPLTVLRGNAEVALELDRTCIHTDLLEEIVEEAARMTRLVEELLLLARSDAGSLPLEMELIAAEPLLAELSDRSAILARERGVAFQSRVNGAGELRIDRARIEQVVMILVDNATKYGSPGATVTLSSFAREREIAVEVTDRGPGIPEADLPFIFERFYRVDKARVRGQGGAGLGLAIARTIVEAHGGRI